MALAWFIYCSNVLAPSKCTWLPPLPFNLPLHLLSCKDFGVIRSHWKDGEAIYFWHMGCVCFWTCKGENGPLDLSWNCKVDNCQYTEEAM